MRSYSNDIIGKYTIAYSDVPVEVAVLVALVFNKALHGFKQFCLYYGTCTDT